MSTRGRKAELKVIEGGQFGHQEPDAMTDVPDHIPEPMREEWRAIVEDLRGRRMMTDAMTGTVDAYVMAMWNARQAQKALDEHGLLIDGGKGILKQNPAGTILGKANATIMRLSAELGLTPASRSRPSMKDDTQSSMFDGGLFDV